MALTEEFYDCLQKLDFKYNRQWHHLPENHPEIKRLRNLAKHSTPRESKVLKRPWSLEDEEYLRQYWNVLTDKDLAYTLDRDAEQVKDKRTRMGLTNKKQRQKWTPEEEQFLEDNRGRLSFEELAIRLGRTEASIRNRSTVLGIRHKPGVFLENKEEKLFFQTIKEAADAHGIPYGRALRAVDEGTPLLGYRWTREEI